MNSRSPRCMASWYKRSYAMLCCSSSPRWTSWQFILNLDQLVLKRHYKQNKVLGDFEGHLRVEMPIYKNKKTWRKKQKLEKVNSVDIPKIFHPRFHSSSSSSCNNRFSAKRCCFCFAAAWSCSQRGSFVCWPSARRAFWASTHNAWDSWNHSVVICGAGVYIIYTYIHTLFIYVHLCVYI